MSRQGAIPLLVMFLFSQILACRQTSTPSPQTRESVPVIFDSDMAGDVDDVGALATLHALADQGEAKILAVGASERNRWTPLCMDAINTFYGHSNIPIGVTKDPDAFLKKSKYTKQVARTFPRSRNWKNAMDTPDAVDVYRSALARHPDKSVVFISVGSMANMSNLLRSAPDEHSDLNGVELVRKNVRHWVCMAGAFGDAEGKPNANLIKGVDFARHAFQKWPTPITFCGIRIGGRVKTGPGLRNVSTNNPIRHAYKRYNGITDRSSFDQVTTLYAIRGLDGDEGTVHWELSRRGRVTVHDDGGNSFRPDPDGRHRYLKANVDADRLSETLEGLMTYEPE